jgi:RNA polymerase sigma-B factor
MNVVTNAAGRSALLSASAVAVPGPLSARTSPAYGRTGAAPLRAPVTRTPARTRPAAGGAPRHGHHPSPRPGARSHTRPGPFTRADTLTFADPLAGLPAIPDPRAVGHREARALTRILLNRLADLEKGTPAHSRVRGLLIELNLSLVPFAARRLGTRPESYEEVVQVGTIGLINAVDRFDPTRGVDFAGFAIPTIVGEIKHFFRDATWAVRVPRRLQDLRSPLADARADLEQRLERAPTVPELAAYLSLSQEEAREALAAGHAYTAAPLDGPPDDDAAPGRFERAFGFEDARLARVEELQSLRPLIATLTSRERLILHLRFTEELPQTAIARRLGVSQMQVSRLLACILAKLRAGLTGERTRARV